MNPALHLVRGALRCFAAGLLGSLLILEVRAAELQVHVTVTDGADSLPSAVYVRNINGNYNLPAGLTGVIDQINRQFSPQVAIVEVGTAVSFPNKDNIRHHVYSFSPPKRFELKLYSGKPSAPVVFDHVGVVTLGCNIHDVMIGYVVVVDTPYHALTDSHGQAHITGLVPGDYIVHAWTPGSHQGDHPEQKLHVPADARAVLSVEIPAVPSGSH